MLFNADAAVELVRCSTDVEGRVQRLCARAKNFAALVVVIIGTRKTRYHNFCARFFDVLSQRRGFHDAFVIAWSGCSSGGKRLVPLEGTVRTGRSAFRGDGGCSAWNVLPTTFSTSSLSCWLATLRVGHRSSGRHVQAGKTHDRCICFIFVLTPQVALWGSEVGCCAGVLEVRVGFTSSQDTRHKLASSH